jgi:hypothetical protein
MLIFNHREKSQIRDYFSPQASVEDVEIQYKKDTSAVGRKRKADEAFTLGISVKATVRLRNLLPITFAGSEKSLE